MRQIPSSWLPDARPTRVILHWTAGTSRASNDDGQRYHFIVEGDGTIVPGVHSVADNDSTGDGSYAAHTRGANTRAIGVALAGMHDAVESPFSPGPYPITRESWAAAAELVAALCDRYGISPVETSVLTHAEVQPVLGIPQRGKWDVTVYPGDVPLRVRPARVVGELFRAAVLEALSGPVTQPPADSRVENRKAMQRWLGVAPDGAFGPITLGALTEAVSSGRLSPPVEE